MRPLPLVSPLERALFLRGHPYLGDLPSGTIAALAGYSEERSFSAGSVLYEAGELPDPLYFLASGALRVSYPGVPAQVIEAPGGVGMIEFFARSEEPPRVVAVKDTMVLAVSANNFDQIVEDDFVFFAKLCENSCRNMRTALESFGEQRPSEEGFGETRQDTPSVLDLVGRLALAREAPLFRDSNLTVLTELLRFAEPRSVAAGECLWKKGDEIESIALILDGAFESSCNEATTFHPAGSTLGAWEIFSRLPRRETARAIEASRVIAIDHTLFVDVLEDHFDYARDYLGKLCRRLLTLRHRIAAGAELQ